VARLLDLRWQALTQTLRKQQQQTPLPPPQTQGQEGQEAHKRQEQTEGATAPVPQPTAPAPEAPVATRGETTDRRRDVAPPPTLPPQEKLLPAEGAVIAQPVVGHGLEKGSGPGPEKGSERSQVLGAVIARALASVRASRVGAPADTGLGGGDVAAPGPGLRWNGPAAGAGNYYPGRRRQFVDAETERVSRIMLGKVEKYRGGVPWAPEE